MSLEAALTAATAAIIANTAAMNNMVAVASAAKGGAGSAGETAAKATRAAKKDKGGDNEAAGDAATGPDEAFLARRETFRLKLAEWLKEFKEDQKDPENSARLTRLGEAYAKLGFPDDGGLKSCVDDTTLDKLQKFLDARLEQGRLTPAPTKAVVEDDDI